MKEGEKSLEEKDGVGPDELENVKRLGKYIKKKILWRDRYCMKRNVWKGQYVIQVSMQQESL
jgi:hypothetical protein